MRRFAMIIGTAMPLLMATGAFAEDVVIRIEAKRGEAAAKAAAESWAATFPDVVTFALSDGWTGIAIGPMPRETATPRLEALKADNKVPADSFIAAADGRNLTPVAAAAAAPVAEGGTDATTAPQATAPLAAAPTDATQPATTTAAQATAPEAAPQPAAEPVAPPAPPEGFYIRVETLGDRAKADTALAKWRETLPEAGMWQLKNGRFTIAIGPAPEASARAWLTAFRNAETVSKDAFVSEIAEMGSETVAGTPPRLGAPAADDAPEIAMPDLAEIQRALRWEGHYDGSIDGKDGPKTRLAIAKAIVAMRGHPEPAAAMQALIDNRIAWRAEMGLADLRDAATGLQLPAPMDRLQYDRAERALSIYGPKDGSGAALILFSQPGGRQEMLDLTGLVTALGWVPAPERMITATSAILKGGNDTHIGYAEAHVVDGHAQGFVLIWPASDAANQHRIAIEIADSITRFAPAGNETLLAPAATTGSATGSATGAVTGAKTADEAAPAPTEARAGQETSP